MKIKYTIEVTQEQCRRFLEEMDEAEDFESGFFYHRFEEHYEEYFLLNEDEWNDEYQFAVVEDRIVGYVFLNENYEHNWEEECHEAYPQVCIWDLYVLPDFRGKGIGVSLIKASLDEQRESFESEFGSFFEIRIGADPLNGRAASFFKHLGFKRLFGKESGEEVMVTRIENLIKPTHHYLKIEESKLIEMIANFLREELNDEIPFWVTCDDDTLSLEIYVDEDKELPETVQDNLYLTLGVTCEDVYLDTARLVDFMFGQGTEAYYVESFGEEMDDLIELLIPIKE